MGSRGREVQVPNESGRAFSYPMLSMLVSLEEACPSPVKVDYAWVGSYDQIHTETT
ncbi:hypothetical protein PAXRUDRAFT_21842 [Paxillus rubicundulus Ve08.2h10]|uniref:Uncharacterized protein n=1 Tax=Paxillus rubicundulus Ve08.2h10 TaxID=930991 RepID=A0A0D0CYM6_9AGAM|nr:hypothetical protein PAXRUDRAFT_21842 [Paxillus rubicundulus Ve08.2h10]